MPEMSCCPLALVWTMEKRVSCEKDSSTEEKEVEAGTVHDRRGSDELGSRFAVNLGSLGRRTTEFCSKIA